MKNIQTDIIDKLTPDIIKEMKKIWFTADLHHNHAKIIDICNRPTIYEDHDEWLIKKVFNKYVEKKDEVYIIGDLSFAKKSEAEKFIARMNGNKHLIIGNHDKNIRTLGNFKSISDIKDFMYSRHGINIHIVLCHYPIASWNRKVHGSWHLYGHVHGRFENSGLSWDVGMDNMNTEYGVDGWLRPINLYEVIQIMHAKQLKGHDKYLES